MRNEPELINAVKRYQETKDKSAITYVTNSLTGFLITRALKIAKGNLDLKDDLVQEGLIAIIKAALRCKIEEAKTNISTYLCACGYGAMLTYIRYNADFLNLGKKHKDFAAVYSALRKSDHIDNKHKDVERMSRDTGISVDKFLLVLKTMNMECYDEDNVCSDSINPTESQAIKLDIFKKMEDYFKEKTPFKYDAFFGRFSQEYKSEEIAKAYKKSRSWVKLSSDESRAELIEILS